MRKTNDNSWLLEACIVSSEPSAMNQMGIQEQYEEY